MSEWKTHAGESDPPIPGDKWVEVCFRDGDYAIGRMHDWDQNWQWSSSDESHDGDIVAYRVVKAPHNPEKGRIEWHSSERSP